MWPSLFSGHRGALGEASTEDSGRLGNIAREPWPGAALVRVAPPVEGRLRARGGNPREVGRQPWPGLFPRAPWRRLVPGGRESAVRVVGENRRGAGRGQQGASFVVTKDVSWGVLVPEVAGCSHPGCGRADSAELGLVGQQQPIREEPPSCLARRRGEPSLASWLLWCYRALSYRFSSVIGFVYWLE